MCGSTQKSTTTSTTWQVAHYNKGKGGYSVFLSPNPSFNPAALVSSFSPSSGGDSRMQQSEEDDGRSQTGLVDKNERRNICVIDAHLKMYLFN